MYLSEKKSPGFWFNCSAAGAETDQNGAGIAASCVPKTLYQIDVPTNTDSVSSASVSLREDQLDTL